MARFTSKGRVLREVSVQEEVDREQQECRRKGGLERKYIQTDHIVDPRPWPLKRDSDGQAHPNTGELDS